MLNYKTAPYIEGIGAAFVATVTLTWIINYFSDDLQIIGWAVERFEPLPILFFTVLCTLTWAAIFVITYTTVRAMTDA